MFEYIKQWYGVMFNDDDLTLFVNGGFITQAQADEIKASKTTK